MDILKKLIPSILIISLFACHKKKEEKISRFADLEPFHSIELNDAFEVEFAESNQNQIEIHGTKGIVNQTEFSIRDCTLYLSNSKRLKWTMPSENNLKLVIRGSSVRLISANKSCIIRSLNPVTTREFGLILKSKANTADLILNNKVFYYWNNFPCGGKLRLSGNTEELKLWNTALMTVDAVALQSKFALVENDSKGDCRVNVSDQIEYKILGEGDIILYGNASALDLGSSNSGSLIRK